MADQVKAEIVNESKRFVKGTNICMCYDPYLGDLWTAGTSTKLRRWKIQNDFDGNAIDELDIGTCLDILFTEPVAKNNGIEFTSVSSIYGMIPIEEGLLVSAEVYSRERGYMFPSVILLTRGGAVRESPYHFEEEFAQKPLALLRHPMREDKIFSYARFTGDSIICHSADSSYNLVQEPICRYRCADLGLNEVLYHVTSSGGLSNLNAFDVLNETDQIGTGRIFQGSIGAVSYYPSADTIAVLDKAGRLFLLGPDGKYNGELLQIPQFMHGREFFAMSMAQDYRLFAAASGCPIVEIRIKEK